jgi:hypothetical protein
MAFISIALSAIAILISLGVAFSNKRSAVAAESAARSAERSAKASEAQAHAIPAQLQAAEKASHAAIQQAEVAIRTADEAKRIAKLSEAEMQASLRPIIVLERRYDKMMNLEDFVANAGKGPALKLSANYGAGVQPNGFYVPNVLSAGGELKLLVDWTHGQGQGMTFFYESQDGRKFMTRITVDNRWTLLHNHAEI